MSEKIFDGRGTVTSTSSDYCVVSVTLDDGSSRSFVFNKFMFYTYGVQCEGNMSNLLENGMEVELCYIISHPERKTCIEAVWLGKKPDYLNGNKAMLRPIYDVSTQFFGSMEGDDVLPEDAEHHVLYIDKDVVFIDGALLNTHEALDLRRGTGIACDAVPFASEQPSGASYREICAWIGPNARDIGSSDFDCEDIVEGTVAIIPNDLVALVDVTLNMKSTLIKVLLFRSSFKQGCARIIDLVDVGDSVYMRLGSKWFYPGHRWWYALNASRTSDEVSLESDVDVCQEDSVNGLEKIDRDKPQVKFNTHSEVLVNKPALSGVISRLPYDLDAFITFGDLKVFVHRDNLYKHKRRCTVEEFLSYVSPGNNIVYFEGILLQNSFDPGKGYCTHEVTCAWVMENGKPPLLIKAPHCKPNFSLLKQEDQLFYGVVSEYVSPYTALALIPKESVFVAVHVESFSSPPQHTSKDSSEKIFITNHVRLNDILVFKLRKHATAGILAAHDVRHAPFSKETWEEISVGFNRSVSCQNHVPSKNPPFEKTPVSNIGVTSSVPNVVGTSSVPNFVETSLVNSQSIRRTPVVGESFSRKCLSQNKAGYLLNCLGILVVESLQCDFVVKLKHVFETSPLDPRVQKFFFGENISSKNMLKFNNVKVRFDAEFTMNPSSNSNFHILRLWKDSDIRPDSETLVAPLVACKARDAPDIYVAKITSIPLPDAAIATTDTNVPLLVTLASLVAFERINLETMTIDSYLSVGDVVLVKVEERYTDEKSCFSRVKCFSGEYIQQGINSDSVTLNEPQRLRWIDVWCKGCYQEALVVFENGKYLVPFVCPDVPSLVLKFDLFEKGKVFVNGELVKRRNFKKYVGKEISFVVSHKQCAFHVFCTDRECSDKGMCVAYAWIGKEPSPKLIFEEILPEMRKGLVCHQRKYEAVIASFPSPFHALCYIGYVPCIARIFRIADKSFDKITHLSVGDRLVVVALEDSSKDCAVVFSYDLSYPRNVQDVYRNVTGTIVALPEPVGKIKVADANLQVTFELCHLRRFEKNPHLSDIQWLSSVRTKLTIGKQVFCSVKSDSKNFRAFEVVFLD